MRTSGAPETTPVPSQASATASVTASATAFEFRAEVAAKTNYEKEILNSQDIDTDNSDLMDIDTSTDLTETESSPFPASFSNIPTKPLKSGDEKLNKI